MSVALSLQKVTKVFVSPTQKLYGIQDISLDIEAGEIVMITGSIGAGKTTLLQLLAGLIKPDQGRGFILGEDPFQMSISNRLAYREKNMGLYFSKLPLLQECSVFENIALPLYIEKTSKQQLQNRIEEVVSFFDIRELLPLYPGSLSLGERQLVSLARAIVNEPKVLILDEPVSSLDHTSAVMLLTHLRELSASLKITTVLTTADFRLHPFATRVVKLKNGKIDEILGEYVSEETDLPFMKI